jgi:hypothetical protein
LKDPSYSRIGKINSVNIAISSKALQIQCNSYQIPISFFSESGKKFLKFIWKHKRPQIAKIHLNHNSSTGGITIPDFELNYTTIVTKQ